MSKYTVTYDDRAKGFTSFYSYMPEYIASLNTNLYTFKNGQVYQHNDESVARNNFYGAQYTSKCTTVFSDSVRDDKIFKTMILESTHPWDVVLSTNYTNGHLDKEEFNSRESRWFTHLRRNEDDSDLHGSSHGIGLINSTAGLDINITGIITNSVSIGDDLYQDNGGTPELIGTISSTGINTITLVSIVNAPIDGSFIFSKKNSRLEGAMQRGYYLEITLENNLEEFTELFAVESNAVKSYI
ncbi:MAG: hypothetical protein ACWA5P_02005 [bacterium]